MTGGTLTAQNSGTLTSINSATLTNVTLSSGSTLTTHGNNYTYLNGAIVNKGTLAGGDGSGFGVYQLGSDVTLSGGGTVTLGAGGTNNGYLRGSGVTLTNQDNTIQGSGGIGDSGGLNFVNGPNGTLAPSGGAIQVGAGGGAFTNQGTVLLASGTGLTVYADSNGFNQVQGSIGSPVTQVDGTLSTPIHQPAPRRPMRSTRRAGKRTSSWCRFPPGNWCSGSLVP